MIFNDTKILAALAELDAKLDHIEEKLKGHTPPRVEAKKEKGWS